MPFQLESNYKPRGDQAQAIGKLIKAVEAGNRHQTLMGVTGSGKTFTVANVIRELDRPTLVISHNKTLAAQLYSEFKQFFPTMRSNISSAISIITSRRLTSRAPTPTSRRIPPSTKRSSGFGFRPRARCFRGATPSWWPVFRAFTASLRRKITEQMLLTVKRGQQISREAVLGRLVDMLYERNDMNFARGQIPRPRRRGRSLSRYR